MDLIERIDELQVLIEEAKSVPFSSSAVVDRDEFLELLTQLKQEVPDEIRQARWMSRDRDELLGRARKEAERILSEAREQRDRLLSRTEIMHTAEREAEKLIDEAKEAGTKMRLEAEDYIDQKLAAFEILLNKTLGTVTRGRQQLQGQAPTTTHHVDVPGPPPPEAPYDAAEVGEPAL